MKGKPKTGIKAIDVVLTVCVILMAGVAVLFLLLPFIIVAVMVLALWLGAGADAKPDQLIVVNESSTPISLVEVDDVRHEKNLKHGKKLTIDWDTWPCTVEIYSGEELLGVVEIEEAPIRDLEQDRWYIIAQDGPEGVNFSLTVWEDLTEVENGWYFFRDDQAEGDAQWDDSACRIRASWNYTAAVYDSENHVLYLFELDT